MKNTRTQRRKQVKRKTTRKVNDKNKKQRGAGFSDAGCMPDDACPKGGQHSWGPLVDLKEHCSYGFKKMQRTCTKCGCNWRPCMPYN